MWSLDKNGQYLEQILETEQEINAFESIMKTIKVKCRSHLNRLFLKDLLDE